MDEETITSDYIKSLQNVFETVVPIAQYRDIDESVDKPEVENYYNSNDSNFMNEDLLTSASNMKEDIHEKNLKRFYPNYYKSLSNTSGLTNSEKNESSHVGSCIRESSILPIRNNSQVCNSFDNGSRLPSRIGKRNDEDGTLFNREEYDMANIKNISSSLSTEILSSPYLVNYFSKQMDKREMERRQREEQAVESMQQQEMKKIRNKGQDIYRRLYQEWKMEYEWKKAKEKQMEENKQQKKINKSNTIIEDKTKIFEKMYASAEKAAKKIRYYNETKEKPAFRLRSDDKISKPDLINISQLNEKKSNDNKIKNINGDVENICNRLYEDGLKKAAMLKAREMNDKDIKAYKRKQRLIQSGTY